MTRGLKSFSLIFFEILVWNVIFGNFMRPYFAFIGIRNVLYALNDFGFERVSFLEQFVHTLRIGAREVRQALQIPGLAARARPQTFRLEHDRVHALALAPDSVLLKGFLLFWSRPPGRRSFLRH